MNVQVPTLEEIRGMVREELARALQSFRETQAPLLSTKEAADQLGVSERTIKRRIESGELPVVRIGRAVRIDRSILRPDPNVVAGVAREILLQ